MRTISKLLCPTLAAVLLLPGCSLGNKKPVDKAKEPIKIGISAPMTSEAASYGEGALAGAMLAVKEINDAGGINSQPLQLVVEDDKCSNEGITTFNKLVNIDKVTAIVGPVCSSAAGPGLPIAQNAGIPTIISATAPGLTKGKDYIFRNYPPDNFQGKFAAEYIYNQLGKRKAAVIYVMNDWGQGLRDTFVADFKQLGGEIVYNEGILQEARDIKTQITKVKALNPDILYFPVYPQNGAAGLKQIKEMGLSIPVFGGDAFTAEEIRNAPGADGVIYTQAKFNNPSDFMERAKQISGKTPNVYTPVNYDAIKMLAQIMKKVGTDRKAIRDELAKIKYTDGIASSLIEFDENGDLKTADYELKTVKDGQEVNYQP